MTVWIVIGLLMLVGSGPLGTYLLTRGVPWRITTLLPTAILVVLSVFLLRTLDASLGSTVLITALVTVMYYAGMLMIWLVAGEQLRGTINNARW